MQYIKVLNYFKDVTTTSKINNYMLTNSHLVIVDISKLRATQLVMRLPDNYIYTYSNKSLTIRKTSL
jgi:hypothetical protein